MRRKGNEEYFQDEAIVPQHNRCMGIQSENRCKQKTACKLDLGKSDSRWGQEPIFKTAGHWQQSAESVGT